MPLKADTTNKADTGKAPSKHGCLFIISAPSGAGKTTLCKRLMDRFDIIYSVSYTTRAPRKDERNGVDYFYISKEEFEKKIREDKWAEWAEVHGNFYGTSAEYLNDALLSGKDILLDIDVKGTLQILKRYPDSITIFIMPPSFDDLRIRMESRGSDNREVIEKRLRNAKQEMAQRNLYKHEIINDNLDKATSQLFMLVEKYRSGNL
ncbi:guanylate kinase [Desulfobacterium sp. N47]|uniref:Guanylate kinase n=1 Tax=uncultured Desulfobacterium sp. TaxID=201089 RepID=E1YIP2_9BACT|nr:Guanylate kinase [uncultured Desulfobacterium sp.]